MVPNYHLIKKIPKYTYAHFIDRDQECLFSFHVLNKLLHKGNSSKFFISYTLRNVLTYLFKRKLEELPLNLKSLSCKNIGITFQTVLREISNWGNFYLILLSFLETVRSFVFLSYINLFMNSMCSSCTFLKTILLALV